MLPFNPIASAIPAKIADNKGYGLLVWYIYGFFFFPIAFLHSLFLKAKQKTEEASLLAEGGKKCPFCAEIIKKEAVICRFCQKEQPALGKTEITIPRKRKPGRSLIVRRIEIFVLWFLAVVGGIGLWKSFDHGNAKTAVGYELAKACYDEARAALKSPATAKFSKFQIIPVRDKGEIHVEAVVDSQNGFGALIRNAMICTMSAATMTIKKVDIIPDPAFIKLISSTQLPGAIEVTPDND